MTANIPETDAMMACHSIDDAFARAHPLLPPPSLLLSVLAVGPRLPRLSSDV
jgi:hypothetical protein